MSLGAIHKTVFKADGVLWFLGWIHIFLGFACLCTAPWDYRQAFSTALWLKAAKYSAVTVLYAWTIAWILRYLPQPVWAKRLIRWGIVFTMLTVTACLILQAGRGVVAHRETSTPFDGYVLIVMVSALISNALLALLLMFQMLWQEVDLPSAYLGGMVAGLASFMVGCAVGVYSLLQILDAANAFRPPPDLRLLHVGCLIGLPLAPWIGHLLSGTAVAEAPAPNRS
ncbi:MAG: hypothetical protein U0Q16_00780 [Bryobacteraceae bacterium]